MRLTIVNQYYPPDLSPTAHLVASLAEHRAVQGDEVTVVTSGARYVNDDDTEVAAPTRGLTVWRAPAPRGQATGLAARACQYLVFTVASAWKLLSMPRQDEIICLTTPPFAAMMLGVLHRWRRRRTKLVLWNMDCYPEILEATRLVRPGGVIARACRRLNRWLFRRVDHVVCLDAAMRRLLQSQYGGDARRPAFSIVPNWERTSAFPARADVEPWPVIEREHLDGKLIVSYLGNAGYGHEFDTIVKAAERLRDDPVAFVFVGGGVQYEHLRTAARNRGLHNLVFHPYVPKARTPSVLAASDLSLVTLDEAALGVMSPSKVHAALAMGVPIVYVGPRGSNVDEAIERFGCGASLRRGEVDELVGFVRRVIEEPDERAALSVRARSAFEKAHCDGQALPIFDCILDRFAA